jgi:hypothetical protein
MKNLLVILILIATFAIPLAAKERKEQNIKRHPMAATPKPVVFPSYRNNNVLPMYQPQYREYNFLRYDYAAPCSFPAQKFIISPIYQNRRGHYFYKENNRNIRIYRNRHRF